MRARAESLDLNLDVEWSPKQWEILGWSIPPLPDGRPQVQQRNVLGHFGGGKTKISAACFAAGCLRNPFREGVHSHDDPPMSGMSAPTIASLLQGPYRELMSVLDERLVLRKQLYGAAPHIDLINGHRINLYSATGAIEGPSLCTFWADEIQHRSYEGKWHNIRARVRDKRADYLGVIVSGIAEHGRVEEFFRRPATETTRTWILQTSDNARHLGGSIAQLMDAVSADDLLQDSDGWRPPRDVVWPSFGAANLAHAPRLEDRIAIPVSAGVDLRRKAAVAICQLEPIEVRLAGAKGTRFENGLLFVDQLVPEAKSAEQICGMMHQAGPPGRDGNGDPLRWTWGPGSVIALDPTASIDEANWFRRSFPGAKVVQAAKGSPYYDSDTGRRAVARAICDGAGNVRLRVHPKLANRSPRGIPEAIRGYSSLKLKDGQLEHMADAARYITQHHLPLPLFSYASEPIDPRVDSNLRSGSWGDVA